MFNIFSQFATDAVNLNIKEKTCSVLYCFISIFIVAAVTQTFVDDISYPILVASMGASAVILFIIPSSPLAQPWPFVGGQVLSAIIGVSCAQLISDTAMAASFSVGGAVIVMLLLKCIHPPGAATALAPVMSGEPALSIAYDFILFPVTINVAIMLLLSITINRWIMRREYPAFFKSQKVPEQQDSRFTNLLDQCINEEDIKHVLSKNDTFIDVTASEINKMIVQAEQHRYKRTHKLLTCADIMTKNVVNVEYGTDVEEAWETMYKLKLQAMPVTDNAGRVIGIITWNDFIKFLDLSSYHSFQDKLLAFIRRSPNINTNKPESVGHLMTKPVIVMSEDDHIVELIPYMTTTGLKQIPIVNLQKRLVGMVNQNQLIAGLYKQKIT